MERLQIHPSDNVEVALSGEQRGHKFALRPIRKGETVIKYGYPIGHATQDIEAGEWVHSHNLATSLGSNIEYTYSSSSNTDDKTPSPFIRERAGVRVFPRRGGDIGIRNELWIIPTVGCINSQAQTIANRIRQECDLTGTDGIHVFTHNYGCSQLGDDHANTRAALAALACHPNAGGVLVLGLGCENNQLPRLREEMHDYDPERTRFLIAQEVEDEVEEGVRLCKELIDRMKQDQRVEMPVSKLRIGLKCGGSDGLSGITANPLVGRFSDWLTAQGGTTILTEVPEMFGAETILMNRARTREVFDKIVQLIDGFKAYFTSHNQPIYENPSPGNKAGGITTLEEKSLGCVQKGGTSPVVDVLHYAQRAVAPGLNLLWAPGNDLVASTALALSGCHMVLFTTGRGTPFGTCVPTLKIATNTPLAQHKPHWIDFSAGSLAEGADPDTLLQSLISKVLATANGEPLRHELTGTKEIAIFKSGVTL